MAGTWKILAHTKLTSANATIDTGDWTSGGTVTNPDTLKVIIYTLSANNDHYCYIRYNGDSGSNYVYRKNSEGEIPDGNPNTNMIYNDVYVHTRNSFVTMHIKNKSDKEKIAVMHNTGSSSGNSNYPARREYVSKWVDKTQQIKRITVHQGNGSNTFDANSYITVWGSVDDGTEDEKQTLADATRTELATATTTLDLSSASQTGTADTKFSVNTSSQQIDWEAKHDGSFDSIWWDLGASAVSDTAWVLHWTLNIDNKPEGNKWLITSLSSSVDSNGRNHRNSNSDSLCLTLTRHNDDGYSYFHIHDTDGSSFGGSSNPDSGDGTATYDFPLDTDLFCELRRTSATQYIGTIRTGSHTGTVIGTITGSCASTVTGLRYLQFSNWDTTSVYDNGTFDGYIKDVKLYNNATEYSSTVSEAPNAGTQYRETDTRKIYRRVAEGTFTSTDYTTSNFTAVGSTVAITSNSAVSTSTPSNTANRVYATIPSLKSTDAWSCDFQLYATADATNDYHTIAFCTNSDAFNTSGQNHISVQTQGGGYQRFVLNARIGGSNSEIATSSNTRSLNTNYYCTLSSDGAGTARMRIWTNSGRTGTPAQDKTLSIANIGTLTTVMHGARNSGDSNVWSGTVSNVSLTNPAKWVERGSA